MKSHNPLITRRSALAGLGAAPFVTGLPSNAHARAGSSVDKAIQQAATKEGKLSLLLHTSATDETMAGMIKTFRSRYPFVNVSYTLQSTPQVMNRFTAEISAGRGITDWLMLPSNLAETNHYVSKGAVAKYVISQDASFPDNAKQSGLWYALGSDRAVTVYRKDSLSDEEKKLVRSFKGLSDPRFRGRLGINGITNSVSVTLAYVLQNHPDKSLWQGLVANKPRVKTASPALLDGLLSGEYDVAVFQSHASACIPARNGAPIEYGNTALTPTLWIPCGISALAPHPYAAKLWQEWILSKEGQDLWVSLVGQTSARSDGIKAWSRQQPWFFDSPGNHKPINWADFASKQAQVVARFKRDLQVG